MSADNIIYIQLQPSGRWLVWEQSASEPPTAPSHRNEWAKEFDDQSTAMRFALTDWPTEYGVHNLPPAIPLDYAQIINSLAFLTDEQRAGFFALVAGYYCLTCGAVAVGGECKHCMKGYKMGAGT